MEWPKFFPEACPPEEAEPALGEVYRLVRKNTPKQKDFKSHREIWPDKEFDQPECIVCGVSVYRNTDDIKRLKDRVPAMRKRPVAKGILNNYLGMILHTPSSEYSHHTWWIPIHNEPWVFFEVIPDL